MSETEPISRRNFLGKSSLLFGGISLGLAGASKGCKSRTASNVTLPYHKTGDTVRVGLIGTGSRGCWLLRNLIKVKGVVITDLCDNLDFHLQAGIDIAKPQFPKVRAHSDYRRLLEQKDLDAVVIATPLYLHAPMTLAAIDANLHVLCEKALAKTIDEITKVYRAAKNSKNIFVVGQQLRWSPVYRRAVEIVKEGAIGKVTHIRSYRFRNNNWRRPVPDPSLERQINWRMYREYSGGLLAELGTHQLDIANWVLGESHPTAVTGMGGIDYWKDGRETYDNVHAIFSYPSGVKVTYTALLSNGHYGWGEQILGDKGTLDITMQGGLFFREKTALKAPESKQHGTDTTRELQKQILVTGATIRPEGGAKGKGKQITEGQAVDPTYTLLENFIKCIKENKKPFPDFEIGARAAITTTMARMSMLQGKIIEWDDNWLA